MDGGDHVNTQLLIITVIRKEIYLPPITSSVAPVHVTVSLCISYIPILCLIGWYCSIKFNQILSETKINLDRSCLGLLLGSCQVGACLLQIVIFIV